MVEPNFRAILIGLILIEEPQTLALKQRSPTLQITLFVLCLLILVSLIFPLPLSTDDYYWGIILKKKGFIPLVDDYLFRLPIWKISHVVVFPLILKYAFLGKLLLWGLGILGLYFILDWFFDRFRLSKTWLPIAAFLVFFAPNQFEILFLVYCMPYCLGFFFVGLGFLLHRKNKKLPGAVLYLLAFLTLETFIVMVLFLEIFVHIQDVEKVATWKKMCFHILPLLFPYAVIRLFLQFVRPFEYNVSLRFHFDQINQIISSCFLIDFYKNNGLLSLLQIMFYVGVGFLLYKKAKKRWQHWAVRLAIPLMILLVLTGYYFFMEYSARRALAGQICVCWGIYIFMSIFVLQQQKWRRVVCLAVGLLLISAQLTNLFLIYDTKRHNSKVITSTIQKIRSDLNDSHTIQVDLLRIKSSMKRDWIFAGSEDVKSMLQFYLSETEFQRLMFQK